MTTKKQIEEKIWDYFDKYNMATHEDEGGVPCADEIAQYIYDIIKNLKVEAIKEFAEKLKDIFVTIDGTFECWEVEEHIDNLVKEMTE